MSKIIAISLLCAVIIIYLKNIKSELTIFAEIMSAIIIISMGLDYLQNTFDFINLLINATNIDKSLFVIVFKAVGIGYLIEFSAGVIEDFGINSLADKLVLVGKIIIISMCAPIIYAIFNLLTGFIK